jgi:hypothetical protein
MKNLFFVILFTVSIGLLFAVAAPFPASAATGPLMSSVSSSCQELGNCELSDFLKVGIWVTQFILGIVGSLALLMFIYGGFTWLISAGNPKSVETGKNIIIGAVAGLALVFCSYIIISFSLKALGYQSPLGKSWSEISQ